MNCGEWVAREWQGGGKGVAREWRGGGEGGGRLVLFQYFTELG